jgi:hypothetical protein
VHGSSIPRLSPRGPLSAWVLDVLDGHRRAAPASIPIDGLDADVQLALYLCYEQHYGGFGGPCDLEWDPDLIAMRRRLEHSFEETLLDLVGPHEPDAGPIRHVITSIIDGDSGPSLSRYMESSGTLDQMRQFVVHRSGYQLKEADPHTWAIPRLRGDAKQLLAQIQAGEYGADEDDRVMHSELFARTMRALGLDDRPNAYLDALPPSALALSNVISLFGLNRRWRSALVGHLTAFEMTSVEPMGRYARGLRRLQAPSEAARFYEVHVLADAEHELLALEMAEAQAAAEPGLAGDITFGVRCALAIERLFAEDLLRCWGAYTDATETCAPGCAA